MRERVRHVRVQALVLTASLLGAASACGDEEGRPLAPPLVTPDAEPLDAGLTDAAPQDDEDAARPDAGNGGPEAGLRGSCAVGSNKIFTVVQRSQPFTSAQLAVDPIGSKFVIPYVASGECLDVVHWASMSGASSAGAPTDSIAIDQCALMKDVAAAPLGDRWLIASIDNRVGAYDIWTQTHPAADSEAPAPERITTNARVEAALSLAALPSGGAFMLAYADEDPAGQRLTVQKLDGSGKAAGDAVVIDQSDKLYFQGISLKALDAEHIGLAYVRFSLDYGTSDIVFVALDTAGKPRRAPWVLAQQAGPSPSVDLASDDEGAGIVYSRVEGSEGRQVWFQQIDHDGTAAEVRAGAGPAAALRIVNTPARGVDVSMTKLRTSFIVTYRALAPLNKTEERPRVRVYFLDRFGAVVGNSDVSYTSSAGGRTAVESANDGRVIMSWNEVNESGSALKVVRLPCLGGG